MKSSKISVCLGIEIDIILDYELPGGVQTKIAVECQIL